MNIKTIFKSVIFCSILLLARDIVNAQGNKVGISGNNLNVRLFPNSGLEHPDAEGSPFLDGKFQEAKINDDTRTYNVRYNVYLDQMELQIDGQDRILKPDDQMIRIEYLSKDKVYETVNLKDKGSKYAELMWEEGGNKLFKVYRIIFTPGSPGNGYTPSTSAKYSDVKESLYFLQDGNNTAVEIPLGKNKRFKALFNSSIKKKAKSDGLDIKNDADLVKLLEKYYQ
jgi:hypothetical protein